MPVVNAGPPYVFNNSLELPAYPNDTGYAMENYQKLLLQYLQQNAANQQVIQQYIADHP